MFKVLLKGIAIVFATLFLIIGSYIFYLWATYIDETVTEGTYYGYTVGHNRKQAFEIATQQFSSNEITGMHVMEPFQKFPPKQEHWELLQKNNLWTLFPTEEQTFFDTIKVKFENDKIIEVHRHRQNFELP